MSYGVLVDLTQCAGGRACVAACKRQNGQVEQDADHATIAGKRQDCFIGTEESQYRPRLSADNFTTVEYHDASDGADESHWVFVKYQCMHCKSPACESACPVAAFEKLPEGPVIYKPERCMGCRYCMMACPFNVPTYTWDRAIPYVKKCTFCVDRITSEKEGPREDRMPACVAACPTDCLKFGDRDLLLEEAHRRIAADPKKYIDYVYGEEEAGGTSWLYLSAVPFENLGFPSKVAKQPYPEFTEKALGSVPPIVVGGGSVLAGLYVIWQRKLELAEKKAGGEDPDKGQGGSNE